MTPMKWLYQEGQFAAEEPDADFERRAQGRHHLPPGRELLAGEHVEARLEGRGENGAHLQHA